jgi:hypothetical protein
MNNDLQKKKEELLEQIKPVGLKDYGSVKATKMFNMFWVNQRLDAVLSEMSKDKNRNTEIVQAIQLIEIARTLMKNYADRLREAETT